MNQNAQQLIANYRAHLDAPIKLVSVSGESVRPYLDQIGTLRIQMFAEFPYLYEGSLEEEKIYLETYAASEEGHVLLLMDGPTVVGFSSAVPLIDEMPALQEAFKAAGIVCGEAMYMGELMVQKPYRHRTVELLKIQEALAIEKGFLQSVFMAVERPHTHPARPIGYRDLRPLWQRWGYTQIPGGSIAFPWKRIDTGTEENNTLGLWMKNLAHKTHQKTV